MNFLFDENFPKDARTALEEAGHSVSDIRDSPLAGAEDRLILDQACAERAIVLTTDRDFFHTICRSYGEHFGIVVIAVKQPTISLILKRLEWFLVTFGSSDLSNRSFQIRDQACAEFPDTND